jgi:two-component system cell cycle sensor histidine kinase/response regulator CckA
VLGIVRAHNGGINVDTTVGKGTTFRVFFPALADGRNDPAPVVSTGARDLAGHGLVLLIDDEEIIRSMARAALENYGYAVALAADGKAGLEMFRKLRTQISTVVLDLTMPNMGGEETLLEMKRIDPDVRVILSTGYDESEVTRKFAGMGLAGFLQKPYTALRLANALKSAVETRPAA